MYSEYYNFGGCTLNITGDEHWSDTIDCSRFRVPKASAAHTIRVLIGGESSPPPESAVRDGCMCRWREGSRSCLLHRYDRQYSALAVRENGETRLCLSPDYAGKLSVQTILESAGLFDILAEQELVVLHASYIVTGGKALLFSGPSGAGKSTQAALWEKYCGAKVVNGDRTLVRVTDATAHGIFLAGTSGICENISAPVRAIIFPERSQRSALHELRPVESFARLLGQCAYYPWDPRSLETTSALAAQLAGSVPIYRFECRRDESSVHELQARLAQI